MKGIKELTSNSIFISYSYFDEQQKDVLAKKLPKKYKIITHPKQDVDINLAVSDSIVQEIIDCDNLIFLTTQKSRGSNWVKFERTYALQLGKKTFAYNHEDESLFHINIPLSPLDVNVIVSEKTYPFVKSIFEWLEQKRFVKLNSVPVARSLKDLPGKAVQLIRADKQILWFLDEATLAEVTLLLRDLPAELIAERYNRKNKADYSDSVFEEFPDWLCQNTVFAKIGDFPLSSSPDEDTEIKEFVKDNNPIEFEFSQGNGIDLGKKNEINMNRVDDMLIRLIMKALSFQSFINEESDDDN
jgi:hypothetical protein